jgi:hypothetical protein
MTRYSVYCYYNTESSDLVFQACLPQNALEGCPATVTFLVSLDACIADDFQLGEPYTSRPFRSA